MLIGAPTRTFDPCANALSVCLDSQLVLEGLRTKLRRMPEPVRETWRQARLLEALHHPGRYVRVVYALLRDPTTPTDRVWPEEELVSLFAPVRRPMSGRGEVLSIYGQEVEAYGFPNDRRLRGLRAFAHRDCTLGTVEEWIPQQVIAPDTLQRKLIRYVPEQKCVVRVRAEFRGSHGPTTRRIAVRCSAPATCCELARRHQSLHAQLNRDSVLDLAPVVGLDPKRGLLGLEWVRGETLTELLHRAESPMPSLAKAVRQFHALRPGSIPEVSNTELINGVHESVEDLLLTLPDMQDELHRLGNEFPALLEATIPGPSVTLHNDLHPNQILFKRGRVILLDLERMAFGSADIDIANLAVQLQMLAFRPDRNADPQEARSWRHQLLQGWLDVSGEEPDPRRFHLLCARSRLELARGMIRHLRPWRVPFAIGCVQGAADDVRRAVERGSIL